MRIPSHFLMGTWNGTNANLRGLPDIRLETLYERFARGGYGIIITGGIMVTSVSDLAISANSNAIFFRSLVHTKQV